jgi:hypothetical protein
MHYRYFKIGENDPDPRQEYLTPSGSGIIVITFPDFQSGLLNFDPFKVLLISTN